MSGDREKRAVLAPVVDTANMEELEALFRAHSTMIYRTAYRVTGRPEDAEDVLQTVFFRLARRAGAEIGADHAESYLRRAAVNAALDIVRARPGRPVSLEAAEPMAESPACSPDRVRASAELRHWLRAALTRLSPAAAEMFVLRYFEELGNPEIARLLGITPGAVAVTLHRTRERIQEELRKYLGVSV